MRKYKFKQNTAFCTGCGACKIACTDKNNFSDGSSYRKIITKETGEFILDNNVYKHNVKVVNISVNLPACDYCEDLLLKGNKPACVEACPLGLLELIQ